MKLISSAFLLAGLSQASSEFSLNSQNVRQLSAQLSDLFQQKLEAKVEGLNSKRKAATGYLENFAEEFDVNNYNAAAESCQIASAEFWNQCKQCTAQQCTKYMSTTCESPNDPRLAKLMQQQFPSSNPNVVDLTDFFVQLAAMGVDAKVVSDKGGQRAQLTLSEYLEKSFKNNHLKKKRNAGLSCTDDANVQIQENNGMNINHKDTVVQCVTENQPSPAKLLNMANIIDPKSEGGWTINAGSSHTFSLDTVVGADGKVVVSIQIEGPMDNDYESPLPEFDEDFSGDMSFADPSEIRAINQDDWDTHWDNQGGYSNGCTNPAGCGNIGGNNEFTSESLFPQDEAHSADYNQVGNNVVGEFTDSDVPPEKPCTEEEAGYAAAVPGVYAADRQDLSDEEFCLSLGKDENCMEYEVPFRRRSSGKRHAGSKGKSCDAIAQTPARCFNLNLECDSCNQQVADMCPSYHAMRTELSNKLNKASKLVEQFTNSIANQVDTMKWYIAVNNADGPSVYVQQATFNPATSTVDMVIKAGSASQARKLLVSSKVKAGMDFDSVAQDITNVFKRTGVFDLLANIE